MADNSYSQFAFFACIWHFRCKALHYYTYINSSGSPVIVGEVVNGGKDSIRDVEVEASFIDHSGNILDSESTMAMIDLIPPGQRTPFMIVGDKEYASDVKSFEIEVIDFAKGKVKPAKLEIIKTNEFSDGIREVTISGEIRNAAENVAVMSKVYATFYDDSNRVIGFSSSKTDPYSIAPNAKANFILELHEQIPLIKSYTLYAESEQFSTIPFGLMSLGTYPDIGNTVNLSRLMLVDQRGERISKFAPNESAWIKSDLQNKLSVKQDFTYIVLIKDKDGFPLAFKWISGVLGPNMSLTPNISWTPDHEGIYYAEIYVWHSMENPIPLSTSIKTMLLYVQT